MNCKIFNLCTWLCNSSLDKDYLWKLLIIACHCSFSFIKIYEGILILYNIRVFLITFGSYYLKSTHTFSLKTKGSTSS